MSRSKIGNKRKKPSHMRYNADGRRRVNKIKRIMKCNGEVFADWWKRSFK